jgi:hypothetical protein
VGFGRAFTPVVCILLECPALRALTVHTISLLITDAPGEPIDEDRDRSCRPGRPPAGAKIRSPGERFTCRRPERASSICRIAVTTRVAR